jgi:hypothetical protein
MLIAREGIAPSDKMIARARLKNLVFNVFMKISFADYA